MICPRPCLSALALVILLSGCASYHEAKRYVEPGGAGDQEINKARQLLDQRRVTSDRMHTEISRNNTDAISMRAEITAGERELSQQQQDLDAALLARRISRAQYESMSNELATLRFEISALEQANSAAAAARLAQSYAADERKLQALRQRRLALEQALADIVKAR